jgi:hypothetical protein
MPEHPLNNLRVGAGADRRPLLLAAYRRTDAARWVVSYGAGQRRGKADRGIFAAARRPILRTVRVTRTTAKPTQQVNTMTINVTNATMSHCSASVNLLSSSTNCDTVVTFMTSRNAVAMWIDFRV